MNPHPNDKVMEYLTILANFQGTNRTGMEGYHDYYEQAGYAAQRIREMGSDAFEGLMIGLNSDNPEIRRQAILLMGQLKDRRALEPIRKLLDQEQDAATRSQIQQALRQISGTPRTPRQTVGNPITTGASNVQQRVKQVKQWGEQDGGMPHLLDALKDEASSVRAVAASRLGLSQMRNPDVVDPLIDLMQNDPRIKVKAEAIMGLAYNKTSHEKISEAVLNLLKSESDIKLYDAGLHALKKHPNANAIPVAMDCITNPKLSLRVVNLLQVYVRRGLVTRDTLTPAVEWMENLKRSDTDNLSKEEQVALNELKEILASMDESE